MKAQIRTERDSLGERDIPIDALFGIQTARARENFPFSANELKDEVELVAAFAQIKRAAARANQKCGVLDRSVSNAITQSAGQLLADNVRENLRVSMLEGAGGTSLNMNVNEVLANRALQILGYQPGAYAVISPNDHVNRSQSTNDVVPSAIQLACYSLAAEAIAALRLLAETLMNRGLEYAGAIRLGRTCLQDAQPMTFGQSLSSWSDFVFRSAVRLEERRADFLSLPMGATAIGTGFGAPSGFSTAFYNEITKQTNLPITQAPNLFDAMSNGDKFVDLAGACSAAASGLGKIANDLILMSSGPIGGLQEIELPAVQPGSSIMPGKVNPVIPMAVRQVAHIVTGRTATVTQAVSDGMLEINHYEPVVAVSLFDSLRLIKQAAVQLSTRCVQNLRADQERMRDLTLSSSALATAFAERFSYAEATRLVKEAEGKGVSFVTHVLEMELISELELQNLVDNSVGNDRSI